MSYSYTRVFEILQAEITASPLISLERLQARLHIGRHTIEGIVHENAGYTFREYQQRARLTAAPHYLSTASSLSIKEIAALLGYNSPRAFSGFFRSATGTSPVEYRNLCNNDQCVSQFHNLKRT